MFENLKEAANITQMVLQNHYNDISDLKPYMDTM